MLNINKSIDLNGNSTMENSQVMYYSARINSDNPDDYSITSSIQNQALYKKHRAAIKAEQAEFEDMVYALVDEMTAEVAE